MTYLIKHYGSLPTQNNDSNGLFDDRWRNNFIIDAGQVLMQQIQNSLVLLLLMKSFQSLNMPESTKVVAIGVFW